MTMNEELIALFQNKSFVEKTASCETVEEVMALVNAEGVEVTRKEFDSFMNEIAETSSAKETELDEVELTQVAGGGFFTAAAIVTAVIAVVGALKWYTYDEPYERGKAKARAENNKKKNKIC